MTVVSSFCIVIELTFLTCWILIIQNEIFLVIGFIRFNGSEVTDLLFMQSLDAIVSYIFWQKYSVYSGYLNMANKAYISAYFVSL